MGKSISPVGLGRVMVKLYPEVKSKQERLKSEWNKRESVRVLLSPSTSDPEGLYINIFFNLSLRTTN
jgi:hypothetical protein